MFPQLRLRLANDATGLAKQVFTFEDGNFFDQPSATRALTGFIRSINEYSKDEAGSVYMGFNTGSSNFNLLFNCKDGDVRKILSKPVAADKIEFGVSNNVLNFMLPYSYQLRFNTLIERAFAMNANMLQIVDDYDLRHARGLFRMTKDERILKDVTNKDQFNPPSFKLIKSAALGEKDGKPLDKLRFTTGIFVEF